MDDLISRQAAIDAARDWYEGLICGSFNGLEKRLRALPAAQPEKRTNKRTETHGVCLDAISRQAAIDVMLAALDDDWESDYAKDRMCELPSAQRWIPCDKGEPDEDMECWVTVKTTDTLYRGNFTKRYGERRDKGFITSGGFMWWSTALAWMPIYEPEPYKEDVNG